MSKIEQLIKEKCPNGVKFYKLSEISEKFTGLSGKTKVDFENGNCRYISYTNLYNNPSINLKANDYVNIKSNEKQNDIKFKDILIAGSSENLEDSGMVSVVTNKPSEKIYLNSFCFGLRLTSKYFDMYNADFLKHLFRSKVFRNQITRCSFGVTRYNLSKAKLLKIKIPCPPIEVQEEIVKILDKFSELEAELEAELEVELETRKKQYEFRKEKLFNGTNKTWKLKDIVDIYLGLTHTPTYVDNGIKFISSINISKNFLDLKNVKYISEKEYEEMTSNAKPQKGDILFVRVGSNLGHPVIFDSDEKIGIFVSIGYLRVRNTKIVDNKYLKHWMNSKQFMNQVKFKTQNAPKANLNSNWLREFEISIPPLQEQERIVNILDKFDKLINDISEGIPAEIEARRKQYEYYRNKLLSFEELKVND